MKTKYFVLGAIFAFLSIGVHAQITELLYQGFESGETAMYTSNQMSYVRTSSSIVLSGDRSLKLVQSTSEDVEVIFDTLDFTSDLTLKYIALEFDHICPIKVNPGDVNIATIWWKRANQSTWTKLSGQDYDMQDNTASGAFKSTGAFNENSYTEETATGWLNTTVTTNDMWKHERFNLNNMLPSSVAASERKLMIKLVLRKRTLTTAHDTVNKAWFIDNMQVRASAEQMVNPKIRMWVYPHAEEYANSRGTRVQLDATTVVTAGINPDSVYMHYRVGSDQVDTKVIMTHESGSRYSAFIPFFGYDTAMAFYCLVRDKSGNENTATFPSAINSWQTFHYVRGVDQPAIPTEGFVSTGSTKAYGFSADADHRSQFIYDSALMAEAGYGYGAITKLKFVVAQANGSSQTWKNMQIRMRNVPGSYVAGDDNLGNYYFDNTDMTVVYNGNLTVPALSVDDTFTVNLQDTFFYAGHDLILQMWYDDDANHSALQLHTIPAVAGKRSCYTVGYDAGMGAHAFTDAAFISEAAMGVLENRPVIFFYQEKNQPLFYDAGISELTSPNFDVAMDKNVGLIQVKLKNYGVNTFSNVRISYMIDDTIFGYKDWSGTLAGGAETSVTVAQGLDIPSGFHTLTVWVEDSVTASGVLYRDHEPFNDTMFSEFIVCDGPMNGVRNIGGSNPHFNTIEEFLFALTRCGVDDSLIVRFATGEYTPFTMPTVAGLSSEHYIVLEPQDGASVTFYSDSTNNAEGCIVNVEKVQNIRFRDLAFVRRNGTLTNMIKMVATSSDVRVERCSFIDSVASPMGAMRITAMLDNATAEGMVIDSCTFEGARIGVNAHGVSSAVVSDDVKIMRNIFRNQSENAVRVENMTHILVEDNEMYDVLTNSSSVFYLSGNNGTLSIQRNKIYTTHGAGALSISSVVGSATQRAIVANNMIVSDDDGKSVQMTAPVTLLSISYMDMAYNAVKLTAPDRPNMASITIGGTVANNRIVNNIFAAFDESNYALSYSPGTVTTNEIGHNVYYTPGAILNRYNGGTYSNIEAWMQYGVQSDSMSISVNPAYLNSSRVDLRTFNRLLKGKGKPIETVLYDMYGNERSDDTPCPGAFEFSSLAYDFEPIELLSPVDNCYMPDQVELVLRLCNNGVNEYNDETEDRLVLSWSVNNGTTQTYEVTQSILAEDTIEVSTGYYMSLPVNGYLDSVYMIRTWLTFEGDPNPTNDTNNFRVVSRYHPEAPSSILDSIGYSSRDTIVPSNINEWLVYNSSSSPKIRSQVYWYLDSIGDEPFYVGDTLVTGELRNDTSFYLRQRRDLPIVRITQIEMSNAASAVGLTSPMPYWMIDTRRAAVQLTNVGDAPADLTGDSLVLISKSVTLNNKVYVFGHVVIEPGKSLVVQYVASGATDSSLTIRNGITGLSFLTKPDVAFLYKHEGKVEDAVPFNDVFNSVQSTKWSSMNVPSYVWSGAAIDYETKNAGVVRVNFNGGVGDWNVSSDEPMSIGSTKSSWIRYEDGGCEGEVAEVRIGIIAPPVADVALDQPILPPSGCGLSEEEMSVMVHNYGSEAISGVELNYTVVGGDTITETIEEDIDAFSELLYTFEHSLNLWFNKDSTLQVKVWATAHEGDPLQRNDTVETTITSRYTPLAPEAIETRVVPYATRDTITIEAPEDLKPVWYDYDMNIVDTGYTHVTEILYTTGTRAVSYMVAQDRDIMVGDTLNANSYDAWPSPYQNSKRYVKQQYIYSASQLKSVGIAPGLLNSLLFRLQSMEGTADSLNLLEYTIGVGMSEDTSYTNSLNWKSDIEKVFERDVYTIYKESSGSWIEHEFSQPIEWDGESSIVVQVSYEATNVNSNTKMFTNWVSKNKASIYRVGTAPLAPSLFEYVSTGTIGDYVPTVRFKECVYGCVGYTTMFNVELSDVPDVDVTVFWPNGSDTVTYKSCEPVALPVKVRNQGLTTIDSVTLYYTLDSAELDSTIVASSFLSEQVNDVVLFTKNLKPGIHTVTVVVKALGDSISSNDTITGSFVVRFCGGEYAVKSDETGDYTSLVEATQALNEVGMLGAITFAVYDGTFEGNVVLSNIYGLTAETPLVIEGRSPDAVLTAQASAQTNYVMLLDKVSNVTLRNIRIESYNKEGNVGKATVLRVNNSSLITIDSCQFEVEEGQTDTAASNIVLQGAIDDLLITNSVFNNGGYGIKGDQLSRKATSVKIVGNRMRNFGRGGIHLVGAERLTIKGNDIRTQNSLTSRGIIGLFVKGTSDTVSIDGNNIILVDNIGSAKRGIHLEGIGASMLNPAYVCNNMVSVYGIDTKGLTPAISGGIWIDSLSSYVNVFFNTLQVRGTQSSTLSTANGLSRTFFCGRQTDHLQIMNNIFSNTSYGYAYYVTETSNVVSSNFNAYYSKAQNPYTWGGTSAETLSDLQNLSSDDGNSMDEEPYFVSDTNLHLLRTNFVEKAQYYAEVSEDIDGKVRSQLPAPTIGAQEMSRSTHDMAVIRVYEPSMPPSVGAVYNIETDSVRVIAEISNNGLVTENNVMWYAYIEGYEDITRSANKNAGSFAPLEKRIDTLMVPTSVGIVNEQQVHVIVIGAQDTVEENNEMVVGMRISPAFNIAAYKLNYTTGCNLTDVPVTLEIRNVGLKPIPSGAQLKIGLHAEKTSPANLNVSTLPIDIEQQVTLSGDFNVGSTLTLNYTQHVNLYPTGQSENIVVRLRGWCIYDRDITNVNDTTSYQTGNSYYTPSAPFGHDTTISYGAWGELTAEQENNIAIKWYRDTTSTPFYAPGSYSASMHWGPTPQYFHDSTYYLRCISSYNCTSAYSALKVTVASRVARDVAMVDMITPLGNRVYMENDTVRVKVTNYGTASQTNVPVTYKLYQGSTLLQTVTEKIPTLNADETLIYKFNKLVEIPNPTSQQTYSLEAYTDLTNDAVRMNDTLQSSFTFTTYSQDRYNTFNEKPESENTKFDITRFSFNQIDFDIPKLDRDYTNLADYADMDYPALHVRRGTTDSLLIQVTPIDDQSQRFRCRASVSVDLNRDGYFSTDASATCSELLVNNAEFYNDSTLRTVMTIPECAELGYMRMRVCVMGKDADSKQGHVIDFMVFVDDQLPDNDLAITQVASPRDPIMRNSNPVSVSFRMANRGKNTIEAVDIYYKFLDDNFNYTGDITIDTIELEDTIIYDTVSMDSTGIGVYHWTGSLAGGTSTLITLPARPFIVGTTYLSIWHEMPNDGDRSNDTIKREYHLFHTLSLSYDDDFENLQYWYAPKGYNEFTRNYWELGMPNKNRLNSTASGVNAWVTDLDNSIVTGRRGNRSYLYSPLFNLADNRADTIAFRLLRNLTAGSSVQVEYYNYQDRWVNFDPDSVTTWYTDEELHGFSGTSTMGSGYDYYVVSSQSTGVSGSFKELFQLRIVYNTPIGASHASAYGEGCAFDDFHMVRARVAKDAGAVAIAYPDHPRYGDEIFPKVIVRNYGTDTLESVTMGYTYYGSALAKMSTVACKIAPNQDSLLTFDQSFVLTSDFPDTFYMRAFTLIGDKYRDNDSCMRMVIVMPLDDDISAEEIVTPLESAVAGDSTVEVTIRMQNFGFNEIHQARAGYFVNGVHFTDELIDFDSLLGRPLESLEFFNYTFEQKMTPSLGVNNITGYTQIDVEHTYLYNDTVSKTIWGMMSLTDLSASAIFLDHSQPGEVRVTVEVENRGTTSAKDFEVGFYIDGDTNTIVREDYYQSEPIPALSKGSHTFGYVLQARSKPYDNIVAFVTIANDNDPSNDTTTNIITPAPDLEVRKVIVEENAANTCRVFLQVCNVGNAPFTDKEIRMHAYINGDSILSSRRPMYIMPGQVMHLEFDQRVPKSPQRKYVGSGRIDPVQTDTNQANDQTTVVDLVNYMEGIDDVEAVEFVLGQNYPNPFAGLTNIPFSLPTAADVQIFVIDAIGHKVYTAQRHFAEGDHIVTVDMSGKASGIYYYGIEVGGKRKLRKMILK